MYDPLFICYSVRSYICYKGLIYMTKPTVFIVGNLYRVREVSRRRGEIQEVHSRTDGRSPTLTRDYQRTPQFQCHNHPILSESKYGKCSKILNSGRLPKRPRQTVQIQIRRLLLKNCLIRFFPVCYSEKNFVNASLDNQHFILERKEMCSKF